jgi:hypothetical protein
MEDSQSMPVDALFRQNTTASIFLLATKVEMASRDRCSILQLTEYSHPVFGPLGDGIELEKMTAALSPRPWLV